jgi:hypothetical protein
MSRQGLFAAALLDPELPCPEGLMTSNGSDPAQRFRVYRNNVIVSLVDALADTFAVTRELVGDEFFRAMARLFAYAQPPQSPQLAFYGAGFPDFIANFPPAAGLPYLADVARLEYRRVLAYHAADVTAVSPAEIGAVLADESALSTLGLQLHPSLTVLSSAFAVVSLWAAHQGVLDLATIAPDVAETALVLRPGLDVEVMQIPPAAGAFVAAISAGSTLAAAADQAAATDEAFDLVGILGLLLQKSAITALHPSGRNS